MDFQLLEKIIASGLFVALLACAYVYILPDSVHRMMWFRGRRQIRQIVRLEKDLALKKSKKAQMLWLEEECDIFESQTLTLVWFSLLSALASCLSKMLGYVPNASGFLLLTIGCGVITIAIINAIKHIPLSAEEMDMVYVRLSTVLAPNSNRWVRLRSGTPKSFFDLGASPFYLKSSITKSIYIIYVLFSYYLYIHIIYMISKFVIK